MWYKNVIVLIFISISSIIYTQNYKFNHYTLEDGLSQETINTILKDSRGFLWLGTQDGLNRFDGDRFEVFKYEEHKNSISGNHITKLLEDDYGNIWIGTGNNGFCLYNPKSKSFKRIDAPGINISDACTGLVKDSKGNIYVSFFNQTLVKVTNQHSDKANLDKISFFHKTSLTITCLKVINNTLFVGTKEGRIFYSNLDHEDLEFTEFIHNNNWGRINTIENDPYEQILIGSEFGLWKLNLLKNTTIKLSIKDHNSFSEIIITDVVIKEKDLWISTDSGLYQLINYHKNTEQFESYTAFSGDNGFSNTISSNDVHCLYLDNDFLWIGVNKLDVLEFNPPVFKTLKSDVKDCIIQPFINNHVFSVYKEHNRTWIGTRAGLNLAYKDTVYNFKKNSLSNTLAYDVIRGIQKDSLDNLWIATTKGLSILGLPNFSHNNPDFISTFYDPNNDRSLSENNTRSVFIDNKQQIWITTFGGGLNLFNGNIEQGDFSFLHFKNNPNTNNSLCSDLALAMIQDQEQNYWIATKNGLSKLYFENDDIKNPIFKTFRHIMGDDTSLSNNSVLSVFEDSDKILWVGTQNGLNKFDPKTETFKSYKKKDGLLNPVVYNILEDDDKNLWLSTNLGLFHFNKSTENFSNYTPKEGLQSTEFNLGAAFKDTTTGLLYFGGINGLNFFDPSEVSKLDKEGHLVFTELRIKNNIEAPSDDHKSVLKENIIQTKKITLKHSQFPFYLNFSNIDLRSYKNNQYLYKLHPIDNTWNEVSGHQEIQFLVLAPGKYKLQVQGKTRNNIWNKKPLELEIEILPPWWKTRAMLLIYFFVTIGILWTTHRFLLQRKLSIQEARKLRELDDQKNKLYTNITHEFRTPITVILGINNALKEHLNYQGDTNTDEYFEMINRNGRNMLRLVNQMLDLAKLEEGKLSLQLQQGNIVEFCKYVISSYTSLAGSKDSSLTFYTEFDTLFMDFDQNKVQQILSNLVTNAIKYSDPGSSIIVHISKRDSNLIVKVKDSGKGICKEELALIFDRFYQIDQTSKREHEGTGIGLALTKELISLMGGEILVNSTLHEGSVFSVQLPITNTAKKIKEFSISEEYPDLKFTGNSSIIQDHKTSVDNPLVLIIEDNKDVVKLLTFTLEKSYKIVSASNGLDGEEKAMQLIPDIIICDVMMPGKDGFELCKTLKNDERTNHIPIILLTAKVTENDKINGLLHGADAYLKKPFSKTELLVRLEKLISLRDLLQKKFSLNSSWQTVSDRRVDTKSKEFIDKTLECIEKQLENANYGNLELAEDLNLSESQCYRKIKAITGFSTAIFIRKVRLQKAKFLLQTTDFNVSEIAYQTGFNDPGWFCKAFKEEFGQSPSAIRKPLISE